MMTSRSNSLKPLLSAFCVLLMMSVLVSSVPSSADTWPLHSVWLSARTAADREAILAQGFSIEAVDSDGVWIVTNDGGLERLRRQGAEILDISPLGFPIDDDAYHTPEEMIEEIMQAQQDHPSIVAVSSIGYSLEGRDVYVVKISDNVSLDEPEPEVLLIALTHAREHLTVEQALDLVAYFSDQYGVLGEVTNLVNEREIWIIPQANPDGDAYDRVGDGYYRSWRKNRRDNGDGTWGVDLNRNYSYKWGYDDYGSSSWTSSETYRGPAPFSEPESGVIRDFVEQHPEIETAINFHTYGELVMWPYGYTHERLPEDMDANDMLVFEQMGQAMAGLNGYTPQRASIFYRTNGDTIDWLYGEHRVFGFTFEMYPVGSTPGFYPSGDVIPRETERNRGAAMYLAGVADNPHKLIGIGGDATSPQAHVAHPVAGQEFGSQVELRVAATDDVGVTLVEFLVDGETEGFDATEPYSYLCSVASPGEHQASAVAYDAGHNRGYALPVLFSVSLPPTPTPTPTLVASPTPTGTPTATPPCGLTREQYLPLVFP